MLKDLVGKKDIDIMVDIAIKGQKFESKFTHINPRLLKNVYIKKIKDNEFVYVEWKAEGRIIFSDKDSCNDCGYSGLMIGDYHYLDNLYLETVEV
jgi:hypothetical protein